MELQGAAPFSHHHRGATVMDTSLEVGPVKSGCDVCSESTPYRSFQPCADLARNLADLRERQLEELWRQFPCLEGKSFDEGFFARIQRREIVRPESMECWALLPQPSLMFEASTPLGQTYEWAAQEVLNKLRGIMKPAYCREIGTQFRENRFRQSNKKVALLGRIAQQQNYAPILMVPVQFGRRHAGHTAHLAVENCNGTECCLGVFEGGTLLITHPDRLGPDEVLCLDLPGDEYGCFHVDREPTHTPFFAREKDGVHLRKRTFNEWHSSNAPASFALPVVVSGL